VVSLCVIERWFHFPPHLSSATTLPWEIIEHKNDQFRRTVSHMFFWDTVYIISYCYIKLLIDDTKYLARHNGAINPLLFITSLTSLTMTFCLIDYTIFDGKLFHTIKLIFSRFHPKHLTLPHNKEAST